MSARSSFPLGTLILGCLLALLMAITYALVKPRSPPAELQGVLRAEFKPLSPFQLQVHGRGPFTEANLRGKWSFVFFGYLSCPDICPGTLYELSRFRRLLEDDSDAAANVQVLFVSLDPARDTGEKVAAYVSHFNPAFIGATAGRGAIDRLTRQFGAGYVLEPETAPGQYLVSHSAAIFLVDPYGRLVAGFSQPHYANDLLAQFLRIRNYYAGSGRAR